jgi:hypothetical protein
VTSLLIATLALAAAQPEAEAPAENEIEVVANRLRNWRGTWRVRDGVVKCKTKRSTGDREIDTVGCDAMVTCMTPLAPKWQEIEDADLTKDELERQLNGLLQSAKVSDCFDTAREQGINALVAARRSGRA